MSANQPQLPKKMDSMKSKQSLESKNDENNGGDDWEDFDEPTISPNSSSTSSSPKASSLNAKLNLTTKMETVKNPQLGMVTKGLKLQISQQGNNDKKMDSNPVQNNSVVSAGWDDPDAQLEDAEFVQKEINKAKLELEKSTSEDQKKKVSNEDRQAKREARKMEMELKRATKKKPEVISKEIKDENGDPDDEIKPFNKANENVNNDDWESFDPMAHSIPPPKFTNAAVPSVPAPEISPVRSSSPPPAVVVANAPKTGMSLKPSKPLNAATKPSTDSSKAKIPSTKAETEVKEEKGDKAEKPGKAQKAQNQEKPVTQKKPENTENPEPEKDPEIDLLKLLDEPSPSQNMISPQVKKPAPKAKTSGSQRAKLGQKQSQQPPPANGTLLLSTKNLEALEAENEQKQQNGDFIKPSNLRSPLSSEPNSQTISSKSDKQDFILSSEIEKSDKQDSIASSPIAASFNHEEKGKSIEENGNGNENENENENESERKNPGFYDIPMSKEADELARMIEQELKSDSVALSRAKHRRSSPDILSSLTANNGEDEEGQKSLNSAWDDEELDYK